LEVILGLKPGSQAGEKKQEQISYMFGVLQNLFVDDADDDGTQE